MIGYLTQTVIFKGGHLDGRTANVSFSLPFSLDYVISFPEGNYKVRRGPMATAMARTQEPFDRIALVVVPQ